MAIEIVLYGEPKFRLFYSSKGFVEGLTVTGYFIYPNLTKSDVFTFDDQGDGIYTAEIDYTKETTLNREKWELVVKEDGVVRKSETVLIFD
jgi:hypothetical protein